nr:hypothetical protein [Tanacetum cinerariifolium]
MMANLSKDIQSAGSDNRPPMLDMSDLKSWQQRIHLYCQGKENRENILQSIDEGPFRMGKFREKLPDDALGPKRDRGVHDLTPEEKERFTKLISNMRNIKMNMPKMQLNSKSVNNMLPKWGGQDSTFDDDVDESPVQDLALNVDQVFQVKECDAFDSDVDEAPIAQTMFMANLLSAV